MTCLALFIWLGFWQLDREAEKIGLLAMQEELHQSTPLALSALPTDGARVQLQPVRATGRYDRSKIFLLDNRVLEGAVGFEVLVPFQDGDSGRWVIVNRGFVPMGRTRNKMPEIPPLPGGETSLSGEVYVGEYRAVSAEFASSPLGDATIVQVAEPALIGRLAGIEVYPHLVRLAESDAAALPRFWPITVMQPETHRGYAVQWFLMAVAVLIAWLAFSIGRFGPKLNESGKDRDDRNEVN